jgi:hypothetical protein
VGPLQDGRVSDLAVGQNRDGRLEVFGVASDGMVFHIAQVPVKECLTVHFKSLLQITQGIQGFIDAQFLALRQLFARSRLGVRLGTTEDLSGNPNLAHLRALDAGEMSGRPDPGPDRPVRQPQQRSGAPPGDLPRAIDTEHQERYHPGLCHAPG